MPSSSPAPSVLIAEDDPAIRRLLGATLRRRRLQVELAQDGGEAIEKLQQEPFDVVVLDLMMPNVDGWGLVEWLREHPDRRPCSVIVMSAADREALRNLDPSIVNAIFFKPFDVVVLGTYVRGACQRAGGDRRHARVVETV